MIDTEKLRAIAKASTRVVGWYAHSKEVRGPFGRWFTCTGGDNGMGDPVNIPTPVAPIEDDCRFASTAMNHFVPLLDEVDSLRAQLAAVTASRDQWKFISCKNPDEVQRMYARLRDWGFIKEPVVDTLQAQLAAVTAEHEELKDAWDYFSRQSNRILEESAELRQSLALSRAEGAVMRAVLEKLSKGWLYWPAKVQADPRVTRYDSRTLDEIEAMAGAALTSSPAPLLEAIRGAMAALEGVRYGLKISEYQRDTHLVTEKLLATPATEKAAYALDALRRALGEGV